MVFSDWEDNARTIHARVAGLHFWLIPSPLVPLPTRHPPSPAGIHHLPKPWIPCRRLPSIWHHLLFEASAEPPPNWTHERPTTVRRPDLPWDRPAFPAEFSVRKHAPRRPVRVR